MPDTSSRDLEADGPPMARLADKVALVTGAGSGIGRAAAHAFARDGARVVLAGRRELELTSVAREIIAAGGAALAIPTDVSREEEVTALIHSIVDRFGRLDAAFNNAGISLYKPIELTEVAEFDEVITINLRGVWLCVKHEIAAMRAGGHGGAVVNTSSCAATGGMAGLSAYAASKGALDSMVRSIALEVGRQGIRVNNISPGCIKTPMTAPFPEEALNLIAEHAALGRNGEPRDVGEVAAWLCSDEARFITGQSILVDGGYNLPGYRFK